MEVMTTQRTIDMNTTEGMCEYVKALPTENLKSIAEREVFYGPASNLLLVTAAECELIARGEYDDPGGDFGPEETDELGGYL